MLKSSICRCIYIALITEFISAGNWWLMYLLITVKSLPVIYYLIFFEKAISPSEFMRIWQAYQIYFKHTCTCAKIAFSLSQSDISGICLIKEHVPSPNGSYSVGVLFLFCILTYRNYFVKYYLKKIFNANFGNLKESGFLISVLYFFALSKKFFLDIFSARLQFLSKHGNCGHFLYFSTAIFT